MAVAKPVQESGKRVTEEEFMRLPQDGKYELVDGEVRKVPANHIHDIIGARLILRLGPFVENIGYLASSQAGLRMTNKNIRCPDLSLTPYDRFPDEEPPPGFGNFAPDLCVEIISPSEDRLDMQRKVEEYFASGARLVWQLFPEEKQVKVFAAPDRVTTLHAEDELDGGDLIPDFRCRVADLFDVRKRKRS